MGPRSSWNTRFGAAAERHVATLLESAGLSIIERRYRVRGGEVDLVALDGPEIVFVEVKARRSARHGAPAEAVDRRKRRRLVTAARRYLAEHPHRGPCRFDVVAVESEGGRLRVSWLRDAFGL